MMNVFWSFETYNFHAMILFRLSSVKLFNKLKITWTTYSLQGIRELLLSFAFRRQNKNQGIDGAGAKSGRSLY